MVRNDIRTWRIVVALYLPVSTTERTDQSVSNLHSTSLVLSTTFLTFRVSLPPQTQTLFERLVCQPRGRYKLERDAQLLNLLISMLVIEE